MSEVNSFLTIYQNGKSYEKLDVDVTQAPSVDTFNCLAGATLMHFTQTKWGVGCINCSFTTNAVSGHNVVKIVNYWDRVFTEQSITGIKVGFGPFLSLIAIPSPYGVISIHVAISQENEKDLVLTFDVPDLGTNSSFVCSQALIGAI